VPRSIGGLVANLFALPLRVVPEIDQDLPLVGALAIIDSKQDIKPRLALVFALHVKSGSRFVAQLSKGPEATHRAQQQAGSDLVWLAHKTSKQLAAPKTLINLAIYDNYLLFGTNRDSVAALGPYVTRTVARSSFAQRPRSSSARGDVPDLRLRANRTSLAAPAKRLLDHLAKQLSATDDKALFRGMLNIDSLSQKVLELVDGLSELHADLRLTSTGLRVHARLTTKDEKARAFWKGGETLTPAKLLDLPDDTVVAAGWTETTATRVKSVESSAATVGELLGQPNGKNNKKDQQASLRTALLAITKARGPRTVMGIRCTGVGITGFASGSVANAEGLRQGLDKLLELRRDPGIKKRLAKASLRIGVKRTRVLNVPLDVVRVRLRHKQRAPESAEARQARAQPDARQARAQPDARQARAQPAGPQPSGKTAEPAKREPIDFLYAIDDARFVAAAGQQAAETLPLIYRPDSERRLASDGALAKRIDDLPPKAWLLVLADPVALLACRTGRPGATAPGPVLLAAGPTTSSGATHGWLRLEIGAVLLRRLVSGSGL